MVRETSAEFQQAAADSKQFTKKPTDNELLEIYALFKVAREEKPTNPGKLSLDFQGKAKYAAWEKIQDKKPEDAEKEYIDLIEKLKETYA